jgi:hypothetical protein
LPGCGSAWNGSPDSIWRIIRDSRPSASTVRFASSQSPNASEAPTPPAGGSFLDEDALRGEPLDHSRHDDRVALASRPGGERFVRGFDPEVELLPRPLVEPDDELLEADRPRPGRPPVEQIRQPAQDVQVTFDGFGDPRALHLYDDLLAVVQPREIGLRDRGRPEGLGAELCEDLVHRSKVLRDDAARRFEIRRRRVFLQRSELRGNRRGDQLRLLRHRLSELDEQTARVLEGESEGAPESGSSDLGVVGGVQEPSMDPDPHDLRVAEDPPPHGARAADRVRDMSEAATSPSRQQLDKQDREHREDRHERPCAEHGSPRNVPETSVEEAEHLDRRRVGDQNRDQRRRPAPVPDPDEPAHNDDGRHGHEDPNEKIDHPDPLTVSRRRSPSLAPARGRSQTPVSVHHRHQEEDKRLHRSSCLTGPPRICHRATADHCDPAVLKRRTQLDHSVALSPRCWFEAQ